MLEYNSIYLTHSLLNWSSCFPSYSLSYGLFSPIRTIQIKCKSCSTLSAYIGFPFHTKASFIMHKATMTWLHNGVTWSHVSHLLTALIPPDGHLLFPEILADTQPRALVLIILSATCIRKFCSFFKYVSAQMWPSLRCTQTAPSKYYEIAQILHQHYSFHCLPLTLGFFHNMHYTTLYLIMYLLFLWLSYWNIDSMREKEKTGFLFFTVASPE